MSNTRLIVNEFAYSVPAKVEEQDAALKQGGVYLYQAALASGMPLQFEEHASMRAFDANGDPLFIPFKCFYGTPLSLVKASTAEIEFIMQRLYQNDEPQGPQIRLT